MISTTPVPLGVTFTLPLVVLVVISFVCTSKLPPSCGVVSDTTSELTVSNSRAVPPEFTLTVLPPCPVRLEGVSVRPAKLPAGTVTVTNSSALPDEFTFTVLPAAPVKLAGVSDKVVNVVAPAPADTLASLVFSASVKAFVSAFAS